MNNINLSKTLENFKGVINIHSLFLLKLYPIDSPFNNRNCFLFESKSKELYYFSQAEGPLSNGESSYVLKRAVNNTSPSDSDFVVYRDYEICRDFQGCALKKEEVGKIFSGSLYEVENFCDAVYGIIPGFI